MDAARPIERVTTSIATPVEKADDPDMGTAPIQAERFTSAKFMQQEWEHLWTKVWLMGGLISDVPEAGDYITTDIGRESVLMIRGQDGKIRAFYNVCQHRGNRLCLARSGHAESLRCGFHFWTYGLDGSIEHIPDLDDFRQGKPPYGLTEIACDTWGAWIWFNLNPDAEPLREYLNVIPQHLDPYHFESMFLTMDVTVEWECNWKTAVDAFNESYHVQAIHPQIMDFLDDINPQVDLYDKHNRYLVPLGTPSPRMEVGYEVPPGLRDMLIAVGLEPEKFNGDVLGARRAVQVHRRETARANGYDYSGLNDDQLSDDYHYMIFPNLTLNIYANRLMFFRQRPHPESPDRMFFDMQLYEQRSAGKEAPPRPEHRTVKHGEISLGQVVDQDAFSLPGTQQGLHSAGFRGLWICEQERRIRHFHHTIDRYLDKA